MRKYSRISCLLPASTSFYLRVAFPCYPQVQKAFPKRMCAHVASSTYAHTTPQINAKRYLGTNNVAADAVQSIPTETRSSDAQALDYPTVSEQTSIIVSSSCPSP